LLASTFTNRTGQSTFEFNKIDDGGFGVVFMAEQTEPARREVAQGMETQQVVARAQKSTSFTITQDSIRLDMIHQRSVLKTIMPATPTQELVDNLQRSVRRWKAVAFTLLVGLSLVVLLGFGAATVLMLRARHEAQAARDAELEARKAVEHFLERDLLDQRQVDRPAYK
jgi:hypothetical protein